MRWESVAAGHRARGGIGAMQPHDRTTSAAKQAAAEAELMRGIARVQVADDEARRVRMRKLAAAMAAQRDRLLRGRRAENRW